MNKKNILVGIAVAAVCIAIPIISWNVFKPPAPVPVAEEIPLPEPETPAEDQPETPAAEATPSTPGGPPVVEEINPPVEDVPEAASVPESESVVNPAPPPPPAGTPQAGDINDKGETWIPGFGWIKRETTGGGMTQGRSDGDWNKIIGDM
ncbi:MAG: hypothetical protein LBQ16_04995 [Gracilibacteraceae bacterium]|jgi:hypothetical protein|nr:hypothetical protein [Gracilibacteraceae bacterium]